MKTETPVDRDKEKKDKEAREKIWGAVGAGLLMFSVLVVLLALVVGGIYLLAWINSMWGGIAAIIAFFIILFAGIGIKFGFDIYFIP